eukprot:m.172118 g.172118  ORF g.172118 m.172118 type:complete len:201 (-) comp15360_c0_seq28:754-1356(-)
MASSGTTAEFNPPINFSMVAPGVYRSGFPEGDNFSFLEKKLKLKSVLLLVPESIPDKLLAFYKQAGVKVFQIGVPGNKEPFVDIPSDKIADALSVILNKNTHPILLHCNKGKHRTGCLVGCLRKLQNWCHSSICDEYRRFAAPKARALDQQFIELFDISLLTYELLFPHDTIFLRDVCYIMCRYDKRHVPDWFERERGFS